MKKVVIISPYLPWPMSSGGNVGVFNMLLGMSNRVEYTFVTVLNGMNSRDNLREICKRIPNVDFRLYDYRKGSNVKYEFTNKLIRRIDNTVFFSEGIKKDKLTTLQAITPGFLTYIDEIIKEKLADVVQIEFFDYLPIVYALPNNVKKIFVHHELRYVVDELRLPHNFMTRFYKNYMKTFEIESLNKFDRIATLTSVDKIKLIDEGVKSEIVVSSLIIDTTQRVRIDNSFNGVLTFIGGDGHTPNYIGMEWFINNIFVELQKKHSNLKLRIIGKWSKDNINRFAKITTNIEFLGFVEDLGSVLKDSIMVVPLTVGSGMRMKILEAASYSVPIVSTSIGAEGLGFVDKENILIADSPKEMACQIIRLIENPFLYQQLSEKAFEKYDTSYSVASLLKVRQNLYEFE